MGVACGRRLTQPHAPRRRLHVHMQVGAQVRARLARLARQVAHLDHRDALRRIQRLPLATARWSGQNRYSAALFGASCMFLAWQAPPPNTDQQAVQQP